MQLWKRLYGTVWIAFFSCVIMPRWVGAGAGYWLHALLGVTILSLTWWNMHSLRTLPVPARLKRISRVTLGFAVFQLICGAALGVVPSLLPQLPWMMQVLRIAHVVFALAILAQASSLATAYDMWEEKEFQ